MAEEETSGTTAGSSTVARRTTISEQHEIDESERRLVQLRPLIKPGYVFALDDDATGRTTAGKRNRPAVLVRVPPLHARTAVALQQRVQVSNRVSWKHKKWGTPPSTDAEQVEWLQRMGWAFSPAASLPGFNKDGIFEIRRLYSVKISELIRGRSLGWLVPPMLARRIMAQSGVGLPERYPPDDSGGSDA